MTTNDELGAALDRLIPKTLDTIITLNRDHAELRIASAADLEPLRAKVPKDVFAQGIADWTFITLDWHPPSRPRQVLTSLFGYNIDRHQGWNTSGIVGYDDATACVRTQSGSLYRIVDKPSDKPDLLRVCAWVHGANVGKHLGVMHIFY